MQKDHHVALVTAASHYVTECGCPLTYLSSSITKGTCEICFRNLRKQNDKMEFVPCCLQDSLDSVLP